MSADSGLTFLFPIDSTSGDIGYPVAAGTGKQILWHYNPTTLTPTIIGKSRAKVIVDDLQPVDLQSIVDEVDSNLVIDDMTFITGVRHRTAGVQHLEAVKDTIEKRFMSYGLQDFSHTFNYGSYIAKNMVGRHPGLTDEKKTIIVDGHFDTVPGSPGADDNASGTVGMLQVMRVLSKYNFRHTLKFIGFDLEEAGLVGSLRYVTEAIPSYDSIIGVLNSEMIGFFSNDSGSQSIPTGFCTLFPAMCDSIAADNYRGNFIFNVANDSSNSLRTLYDSCARVYVPNLRVLSLAVAGNGEIAPDLRRSDHAPFWDAGYKALFLTIGGNYRNPNYHLPSDTVGTINFTFMTNVIKATLATAATLAGVIHGNSAVSDFFIINITFIPQANPTVPETYLLAQNYPNPFNPSTKISWQSPVSSWQTLKVYDVLGNEVAALINEEKPAGSYSVEFDAANLPSGIYFYRLQVYTPGRAGSFVETKKMILLR
ncbi:M28 family peptidase [Bacteroidota bacterium]